MLERLVTDLCLYRPFMARAALSTPATMDGNRTATACTDGRRIWFSPGFMEPLSHSERLGIYAHEVGHSLLFHFDRRGSRDVRKWNIAADLELNPILLECGFTLPLGVLLPEKEGLPPGLCAEQYYDLLRSDTGMDVNECMGDGDGDADGAGAMALPGAADWRAAVAGYLWGDAPAGLRRLVGTLIDPPVPLAARIAHWLRSVLPSDEETWAPRSRRYELLPGTAQRPGGHVAVCVDTSGSVTADQLATMLNDIRGLADVGRVDVIMADADVQAVYEDVQDVAAIEPIGGGGTAFRPALARAAALGADCAIYMTDGFGDRDFAPPLPTYWHILEQ